MARRAVPWGLAAGVALVWTLVACAGGADVTRVDLDLDDLELDPATDLPIVPGDLYGGLFWWIDEPTEHLDPGRRLASGSRPAAEADPGQARVTLLAATPDHEAALATAGRLAAAVGDPEAESAWLEAAGQPAGSTFDWLGSDGAGAPFVQVVDRWLIVEGLAPREEHDQWEAALEDGGPVYRSPLASALRAGGAVVLVEGDRAGEGSIAFDAVCAGDPDRLRTLGQELADHGQLSGMRPPWLAPPLTDDEQRARRTLRFMRQRWSSTFFEALEADGEFTRLRRELTDAAVRGDDERTREAIARLQARIASIVPDELPDLGPLEEVLDADVAAEVMADHAGSAVIDPTASEVPYVPPTFEEHRREAAPFGAFAPETPWRSGTATYGVEVEGERLSVYAGLWTGIARGLVPFVDYLEAGGCDELRFVFHDYDDVRGD